jgi:hypothetical protein
VLLALIAGVVWGISALVRTLTAQGAETGTSSSEDAGSAASADGSSVAGSEDDAAASTAAGAAEDDSKPQDAGPVDPDACSPRDLDVTMSATPASGEPTSFAVSLTNRGDVACLLDAGTASLVLTVHSGEDRVWSSGDCAAEPAERKLLLDAGDSTETAIKWDGTRSEKGCPAGQGTAQAGSYRVAATLGGASLPATETSFTLG